MNRQLLGFFAAILILAFLPALGAYPIFVMKIMCYALFACAFNLLLGYTGLLSFGHAAFLGELRMQLATHYPHGAGQLFWTVVRYRDCSGHGFDHWRFGYPT